MATIATLIVDVVANTANLFGPLDKDTQRLEQSLNRMSSSMTKVGAGLTAAVTVPIVGIGAASLKMAMDAVESENLFEVSFKDMAGAARAWSEETSAALGLNQFELRRTSATLFTMLDSMGIAKEGAFAMATGMTELAHDMASFFNLKPEEAFEKLRAGIVGEAEPLKRLGILVDENTVKTAAYKHGIAEQGKELTQQQKVLARYAAIMDQTKNAQGDLARTLDSPTNQLRRMREQVTEAATAFGMALLPAAQQVIAVVSTHLIPAIQAAVQIFANLPAPVQTGVIVLAAFAAALGPLLLALGYVLSTTSTLLPILRTLGLAHAATAAAATAQTTATTAAGTAAATAAPQVTVLGTALRWASAGAALFGAAIAGWAIGKWIADLQPFGKTAMSIGESFEFGATKLFNWIRGMEVADEDIERAIVSRRKLAETTTELGTTEQDVAAAMEVATRAARDEAAAVTAGAAATKAAERDAAKLRQTMNELGEAYMEADAAQLAFEQSARQLHTAVMLLAPAIQDNQASLDAYTLIAIDSVEETGALAQAAREAEAELRRMGIALDFTAHQANNASQQVEKSIGVFGRMGDSVRSIWQGMTGGGGLSGLLGNLGVGVIEGFGNIISGGLSRLISSGVDLAIGGLKKLFGIGKSEGRLQLEEANSQIKKLQDELLKTHGSIENIIAVGGEAGQALADAWGSQNRDGLEWFTQLTDQFNDSLREQAKIQQDNARAAEHAERIASGAFVELTDTIEILHAKLRNTSSLEKLSTSLSTASRGGVFDLQSILREVQALTTSLGTSDPAVQVLQDAIRRATETGVLDFAAMAAAIEELKKRMAVPIVIPVTVQYHDVGLSRESERREVAGLSDAQKQERIRGFLAENVGDRHRIPSALGISGAEAQRLGFQHGTAGRFLDFGAGTNVRLHGRERVMTEGEGRAEATSMAAVVAEVRALRRALRDDLFLAVRDGTAHRRAA